MGHAAVAFKQSRVQVRIGTAAVPLNRAHDRHFQTSVITYSGLYRVVQRAEPVGQCPVHRCRHDRQLREPLRQHNPAE
jgi:hypothetical protein